MRLISPSGHSGMMEACPAVRISISVLIIYVLTGHVRSVARTGNGAGQACWRSRRLVPAGKVAGFFTGGSGLGMTSEQSIRLLGLWPTTASFAIADLKLDIISCWLSTMLCHSQAVRCRGIIRQFPFLQVVA